MSINEKALKAADDVFMRISADYAFNWWAIPKVVIQAYLDAAKSDERGQSEPVALSWDDQILALSRNRATLTKDMLAKLNAAGFVIARAALKPSPLSGDGDEA